MMNDPREDRETWREFEQRMQDWALSVCDVAEMDYGWDYMGDAPFGELMEWTELRYLDGKNYLKPEDEFQAYLDHLH